MPVELTILMPCLNEAETLEICIVKAQKFLATNGVDGEVLIADNGSTDGSVEIALRLGARVLDVRERGYGSALRSGIAEAEGRFVIMGDADDSYDFLSLEVFLDALRAGSDLVVGNRFKGGIDSDAMPALHRYLGNPVLSYVGRKFYGSKVKDFHCGLRGFSRAAMLQLGLKSSGMEFATEMVVRAELAGLAISEVPTTLKKDGRSRSPHLRTWRDGWRHLRFLLLYSPRWMFIYPGILALVLAAVGAVYTEFPKIFLRPGHLGVDTLAASCGLFVAGAQAIIFGGITKIYGVSQGYLPRTRMFERMNVRWLLEVGLALGALVTVVGVVGLLLSFLTWQSTGFAALDTIPELRKVLPLVTLSIFGLQIVFASLFAAVIQDFE